MDKTAPIDNWNIETSYVMSIDIGWGSSANAIMVSRWVNNRIQIVYSKARINILVGHRDQTTAKNP